MDTSSLTDLSPKANSDLFDIQVEPRDQLYHGRFQYVFEFVQPELYCVRGYRKSADPVSAQRSAVKWYHTRQEFRRSNFLPKWLEDKPDDPEVAERKIETLTALAGFLKTHQDHVKLTISNSTGYFYNNDLGLVEQLIVSVPSLAYIDRPVRQALVAVPAGCISLRESQYAFRSYFSGQTVSPEKKQQLTQFLQGQSELRLGPALADWCAGKHRFWAYRNTDYLDRHFFIDHNDMGIVTMLSLMQHHIIRKTVNIVTVNNTGDNYGKNT